MFYVELNITCPSPCRTRKENGLARAIGEVHRRYTRMINFRENARGFLFQGRFSSCPVDTDKYLIAAIQYIERNPFRAKIVKDAWEYPWSSAGFHCGLVKVDPLIVENQLLPEGVAWRKILSGDTDLHGDLEEKNRTGRPFGPDHFDSIVENITGRDTKPGAPGRPAKKKQ